MFKKLTLLLTFGILFSAVWTYIAVYAQNNNATNTVVPPKIHTVKITSPAKGQQLPIGDNLIVSGTSSDNATPDCQVSVIANGINHINQLKHLGLAEQMTIQNGVLHLVLNILPLRMDKIK